MQRTAASLLFLISFFILFASSLNAQEAGEQTQQTLLPEIDPQDIEIRSQFQARFPGLRRQPILGFNPRPRVFQVDPNRTPFIESEEAIAASVPVGELDRPDAPAYRPLSYADPTRGFARLGIGTYVTPEADVYAIHGFGGKNWVSGNVNHRSSNGHLDDQNSAFRDFNATVRSQFQLSEKLRLRMNTGTHSDFNYLPADETDIGPLPQAGGKSTNYGFRFGGDLDYDRTSITGLNTAFNIYTNNFEIVQPGGEVTPGEASEWGGAIDMNYSWAGSRVQEVFTAYGGFKGGSIDMIDRGSDSWSIAQAGARYERLLNYQTDIDASFGVALVSDAFEGSTFYITPEIDMRHTLLSGVDVRARLSGKPSHKSFRQYRQMNRFLGITDPVSHQYASELRGEVILEPLSGTMFTGGIQFQHVRNYAYFTRSESIFTEAAEDQITRFAYQPNFSNANFMKVYASFSQQLAAEKFWVSADAFWQRPRLSGNERIPFVESLGVKGTASYRPIRDLVIEGWVDFTGSRHNPVGSDLDAYFLLGTRFELAITNNAGIYAKLLNINDVSYEIWQGYEERGFQGYVGITYIF